MKIISIRKIGPELFKIKYKGWLEEKERFIISEKIKPILGISHCLFYFRDTSEYINTKDGQPLIEWMIRNKVDFFSNKTGMLSEEGKL